MLLGHTLLDKQCNDTNSKRTNENTKSKFDIFQINPIFTSYNYTVTEAMPSQRATQTVVDSALSLQWDKKTNKNGNQTNFNQ